jgi:hypothetical protein
MTKYPGERRPMKKARSPRARNHRHGHKTKADTSPEYITWRNMIGRCSNPRGTSYPRYGGRGIEVCERWRADFLSFFADMGPKPSPQHSIERIDNDGNYEPGNCRWASLSEQANNRRSSRLIEHAGQRKTLVQWARASGIGVSTLHLRLRRGVPMERALNPQTMRGT